MDSSFDSMRRQYKAQYDALKREYAAHNIGILDETPDIENAIALSDVYIGDSATSVTSLFGAAGKPLFILNNHINTLPEKDDWRGEWLLPQFDIWGNDKYMVTKNNQLWISENCDYHYKFYMDLGDGYSGGEYYLIAVEIGSRVYVLPRNARHLLVIENQKLRRIDFREDYTRAGAFYDCYYNQKYIFLLPYRYPHLVRFDVETEQGFLSDRNRPVSCAEYQWRMEQGRRGAVWERACLCLAGGQSVFVCGYGYTAGEDTRVQYKALYRNIYDGAGT